MIITEELMQSREIPKIKDITLKQVQEYHDLNLVNKRYIYTLRPHKKKETFDIEIRFFTHSLPHLLGIHKVVPSYSKRELAGECGYNKIFNEEITIDILKNFDKQRAKSDRQFPKIKDRITHYFLIDYLMENCKIVKFDASKVKGNCTLKSDFILFNEDLGVKLQLGVVKEEGKYSLKDRLTSAPPQTYMNIMDRKIIDLNH